MTQPVDTNSPAYRKAQLEAEKLLSGGRILARQAAPYFRPMILKLRPVEVPGHGTVSVTAGAQFLYDPVFIARQRAKQVAGLIIHEVMHLWNDHGRRCGMRDHGRWNQAADRAINPGVLELGLELPDKDDTGCFPVDIGMQNGLTADAYYREQEKQGGGGSGKGQPAPGAGQAGAPGGAGGQPDPNGQPGKGKVTGGCCGGCAGQPAPGEATAVDPADERAPAEMERTAKRVAEAMTQHAGEGRGKVPAEWLREAAQLLEPARVPWAQLLSQALRAAITYRAGSVTHRYDGPSRRQAAVGYGHGVPILARLRQPQPEVGVGVDTSGSMGKEALGEAALETNGILRAVGAHVQVVTCDAHVHGVRKVARIEDVLAMLVGGGGGTDFRPVFAAVEKMKPRPEVFVFITDCDGPWPDAPPPGVRVLVVRVGRYKGKAPSWAHVIEYDELKTDAA